MMSPTRPPLVGEGWGLSHIGHTLVMDDGSSSLFFIDPDTFKGRSSGCVYFATEVHMNHPHEMPGQTNLHLLYTDKNKRTVNKYLKKKNEAGRLCFPSEYLQTPRPHSSRANQHWCLQCRGPEGERALPTGYQQWSVSD